VGTLQVLRSILVGKSRNRKLDFRMRDSNGGCRDSSVAAELLQRLFFVLGLAVVETGVQIAGIDKINWTQPKDHKPADCNQNECSAKPKQTSVGRGTRFRRQGLLSCLSAQGTLF
jgi:hypothetical protein